MTIEELTEISNDVELIYRMNGHIEIMEDVFCFIGPEKYVQFQEEYEDEETEENLFAFLSGLLHESGYSTCFTEKRSGEGLAEFIRLKKGNKVVYEWA